MKKITTLTLAFGLAAALARGADDSAERLNFWPQWRGPLATGVAPNGNPPLNWDEKTNLKWKAALPGKGSSTPIVWGDQVFALTVIDTGRAADPADLPKPDPRFNKRTEPPKTYHQFVVLSIDRNTGKVRWQQTATERVPHEGLQPTNSYAAASPTTDGRYLYVSFGSRGIYCYDLAGNLQWQRDLGIMHTRLGWGEGISPVIHGDALIVNWDHEGGSFIIVLDAKTGKTKWKADRDEPTSWATPLVVEHKGRTQVIVSATKRVRSYDLATGGVLWQSGGQTTNVIPSPVALGDFTICMSGYRGATVQAIPLDSSNDITGTDKIIWTHGRGTPYVPSPLLYGDRLYFTQGNTSALTCLDAKTGKPLIDRERLPGLTSIYASPAGAADRIYITARDGTTLVLKRGDKLEVLATNRLDDPTDASPAIAGNQLFLRSKEHLYCFERPAQAAQPRSRSAARTEPGEPLPLHP
jgi:outer membrane protein assembly factor BamB